MQFYHQPVMLKECVEGLNIKPDGIYVDGTCGGGNHSFAIAERLSDGGRLIAVDKDGDAIAAASEKLSPYIDRLTFVRDDFKNLPAILDSLGVDKVDGILLDLGVSSYQLDNAERGFSYMQDAPLDMRMDRRQSLTAKEVVNYFDRDKLISILRDYGEEKLAARIADNIIRERAHGEIETTKQLATIVEQSYPAKTRWKFGHPAKRTFQAIRIAVNDELTMLEETVEALALRLKAGGRIAVITFHSLEDRMVKTAFKKLNTDCVCPPDYPVCVCNHKRELDLVNKKPIEAGDAELEKNPRAKSAKLRIAQRTEN